MICATAAAVSTSSEAILPRGVSAAAGEKSPIGVERRMALPDSIEEYAK